MGCNQSAEAAQALLDSGVGHLVYFGRSYLANPDLVNRLQNGIELAAPKFDTFYSPGPEGYTDYPTAE